MFFDIGLAKLRVKAAEPFGLFAFIACALPVALDVVLQALAELGFKPIVRLNLSI